MKAHFTAILLLVAAIATSDASTVPRSSNPVVDSATNAQWSQRDTVSDIDSSLLNATSSQTQDVKDSITAFKRQDVSQRGLYVDESTCTGDRFAIVSRDIKLAKLLAQAANNALTSSNIDLPGNPAPYFFGNPVDPRVASIFRAARSYATGDSEDTPIRITCADQSGYSATATDAPAHIYVDDTNAIVLCADYFAYPSLELPCSGGLSTDGLTGVGGTTRPQILLHMFIHAWSRLEINDFAHGTRSCHRLLRRQTPDENPSVNADSYSRFAAWAYDLGLLNDLPDMPRCLELFLPERWNGIAGEMPRKRPRASRVDTPAAPDTPPLVPEGVRLAGR